MWNSRPSQEDDDSWEVRAFAEDTGNIMGTTWPPRSYSCTFCRREFRSAQALGGHMNVHRRDRARLRQSSPGSVHDPSSSSASSSTLFIPTQEFVANGGLCLLYPLQSPNSVFTPTSVDGLMDSPSNLLSISHYHTENLINFPSETRIHAPLCHHSEKVKTSVSYDEDTNNDSYKIHNNGSIIEEQLDLELRLGQRPSP